MSLELKGQAWTGYKLGQLKPKTWKACLCQERGREVGVGWGQDRKEIRKGESGEEGEKRGQERKGGKRHDGKVPSYKHLSSLDGAARETVLEKSGRGWKSIALLTSSRRNSA